MKVRKIRMISNSRARARADCRRRRRPSSSDASRVVARDAQRLGLSHRARDRARGSPSNAIECELALIELTSNVFSFAQIVKPGGAALSAFEETVAQVRATCDRGTAARA